MMTWSFLAFAQVVSTQTEETRETLSPALKGKQAKPGEGCVARSAGAGKAECLGRPGPLSQREVVERKGEDEGMGQETPDPGTSWRRPNMAGPNFKLTSPQACLQ